MSRPGRNRNITHDGGWWRAHSVDYRYDRGTPKRGTVARTHHVYLPWPRNVLCRLRGHQAARGTWKGDPAPYVECARCRVRPARLVDVHVAAEPGLKPDPRTTVRGFRDYEEYAAHVAAGREVLWPGHPALADRDVTDRGEHLSIGTYVRGKHGIGFAFELAGKGAETPFHFNVYLGFLALYISTTRFGRHLAERLVPDGENRQTRMVWRRDDAGAGSVLRGGWWWEVWHGEGWSSGTPWWRCGHFAPVPWVADRLWGRVKVTRDKVGDPVTVTIRLPEGDYDVTAQLELTTRGRPRRRKTKAWWSADCETGPGGIPTGPETWKGHTIGWSVPITDPEHVLSDRWTTEVVAESTARFLRARADRHGATWQPPARDRRAA